MGSESRARKRIYTAAVALGLTIGSIGIAAAASSATSAPEESTEEASEIQDPAYTGSVQAPADNESLTEAEESAQLEGLVGITSEAASEAASAEVAGDVLRVQLDNENGTVVYSVEVVDGAGNVLDVTVDAGDGTILDQQSGNDDSDEADEADESADDDDVQHENEHEGENDPDDGHED